MWSCYDPSSRVWWDYDPGSDVWEITDLNELAAPSCGTLSMAWDINDAGQVVGHWVVDGQPLPRLFVMDLEGETNCNGGGTLDACDIAQGDSEDCNGNGYPDECDIDEGFSGDDNGNGIPNECQGDMNCDRLLNGLDIQGFVWALIDPVKYASEYSGCNILHGDMDGYNDVDMADIPLFIDALLLGF